jgi:hypothetical protein
VLNQLAAIVVLTQAFHSLRTQVTITALKLPQVIGLDIANH